MENRVNRPGGVVVRAERTSQTVDYNNVSNGIEGVRAVQNIAYNSGTEDENNPRRRKKDQRSKSRSACAKLLSLMYGVLLMILGVILPLQEAVQDQWLANIPTVAFTTYLSVIGTIFLLYMQFHLLPASSRHKHDLTACCPSQPRPEHPKHSQSIHGRSNNRRNVDTSPVRLTNINQAYDNSFNADESTSNIEQLSVKENGNCCSPDAGANEGYPVMSLTSSDSLPSSISKRSNGMMLEMEGAAAENHSTSRSAVGSTNDLIITSNSSVRSAKLSVVKNSVGHDSHQSASLFIRFGILLFGIGNIIYYVLEIQGSYRPKQDHCGDVDVFGWSFIPRLVFVIVQTFFLFKGSVIKITPHQPVAWFGLMHLLATNACLWFRIVIRETYLNFQHAADHAAAASHGPIGATHANISDISHVADYSETTTEKTSLSAFDCQALLTFATSYLFPVILEYSLTAIGILLCFTQSGLENKISELPTTAKSHNMTDRSPHQMNPRGIFLAAAETRIECLHGKHQGETKSLSKSHLGLYLGVLLIVSSLASAIYIHIYQDGTSITVYLAADIFIHGCMLINVAIAFYLTSSFGYRSAPVSADEALLLFAMTGSVMFEALVAIPYAYDIDGGQLDTTQPLYLTASLLNCVESIAQTLLIFVSLHRSPSTKDQLIQMPGRGSFGFLILGNVAAWVFRTLVVANGLDFALPTAFYGNTAWLLIRNINLPILLFFRFHSSVCFAEVWHIAYAPSSH